MRFHVPGIPHTVTTAEYSSCAFTAKVLKLCKMLRAEGHYVIHYGHVDSEVDCDKHVTVTTRADMEKSYPGHDWRKDGWPAHNASKDYIYGKFFENTNAVLRANSGAGDFLLLSFGFGHKPLADANRGLICVEPGIGYPVGGFCRFRVFESNSIRAAYLGQRVIEWAANDKWYDTVIPNYFDAADFTMEPKKDDYFMFLGRVNAGKGFHIAQQLAEKTETRLVVAGAGDFPTTNKFVERVGVVAPAERAKLLSKARATICASTFMEPFCGVQIESFLSGTPVISSDWGAFVEYNRHGVTGYRCSTFEQFEWAARNIQRIDPFACRIQGSRFTLDQIGPHFTEYFNAVHDVYDGKGWYAERKRCDLNHTTFGA